MPHRWVVGGLRRPLQALTTCLALQFDVCPLASHPAQLGKSRFGVLRDCADLFALFNGGQRGGQRRFFTYSLMPDSLRCSETAASFFADMMSKHAMHAGGAEEVLFAGEGSEGGRLGGGHACSAHTVPAVPAGRAKQGSAEFRPRLSLRPQASSASCRMMMRRAGTGWSLTTTGELAQRRPEAWHMSSMHCSCMLGQCGGLSLAVPPPDCSGTFAPPAAHLPLMRRLFEANFPGACCAATQPRLLSTEPAVCQKCGGFFLGSTLFSEVGTRLPAAAPLQASMLRPWQLMTRG